MRAETAPLTIGRLARQAEVGIQTIRYYERRGLLPDPGRTAGNYRTYPAAAVRRVRFIKRAQALGFTLREVGELLALRASAQCGCTDIRAQATAKMRDIDGRIASLERMRVALDRLVTACSKDGPASDCPILDYLESGR